MFAPPCPSSFIATLSIVSSLSTGSFVCRLITSLAAHHRAVWSTSRGCTCGWANWWWGWGWRWGRRRWRWGWGSWTAGGCTRWLTNWSRWGWWWWHHDWGLAAAWLARWRTDLHAHWGTGGRGRWWFKRRGRDSRAGLVAGAWYPVFGAWWANAWWRTQWLS